MVTKIKDLRGNPGLPLPALLAKKFSCCVSYCLVEVGDHGVQISIFIYQCSSVLYTCIKSLKNVYQEIILKLATDGQSDLGFLLTSELCHQGVVCSWPRAIYMMKILKICIKSDFKVIFLKLATNGKNDKAFLLT